MLFIAMSLASRESVPLLPVMKNYSRVKAKVCINSKAAHLILLWNFSVVLGYKCVYNIEAVMQVSYTAVIPLLVNSVFGVIAVVSPMIGLLTDIKISRHKAVTRMSYIILAEVLLTPAIAVFLYYKAAAISNHQARYALVLGLLYFGAVAVTLIAFLINAFQFGMDQLQDCSTEDLLLYIHWYVWIQHACSLITGIPWNLIFYDALVYTYKDAIRITGVCMSALIVATISALLLYSLCVMIHRKAWFLFEPPVANPYKLVYGVIKFASQHKVPLKRSAFTYCEDEAPSRLDLGKTKYGGPFTTKQVEDVKAFLGIIKILLVICPAFLLQTVIKISLPPFARHGNVFESCSMYKHTFYPEGIVKHIIISNGMLSPMLVVTCLPLYLWCIRPYLLYHIPSFFKRIGLGMITILVSLLCALAMDIVVHAKKTEDAHCMFISYTDDYMAHVHNITDSNYPALQLFQNAYFLVSQSTLSALVDMLLDIAVLELICSQSPY